MASSDPVVLTLDECFRSCLSTGEQAVEQEVHFALGLNIARLNRGSKKGASSETVDNVVCLQWEDDIPSKGIFKLQIRLRSTDPMNQEFFLAGRILVKPSPHNADIELPCDTPARVKAVRKYLEQYDWQYLGIQSTDSDLKKFEMGLEFTQHWAVLTLCEVATPVA